jgi:hypothetical protein
VRDFNLIRRPSDRNRLGGNIQEMLRFNKVISHLGLEELPLQGNRFTWSNMQTSLLLERLEWFFASIPWFTSYPSLTVSTLSRDISDHHPCLISMNMNIPQSQVFRFENYWLLHDEFMPVMQHGWNVAAQHMDSGKRLMDKFKNLRRILRCWYTQISNLASSIQNNKLVLNFLDTIEEYRDLTLEEWNFRAMVHDNLNNLLEQQRIYRKQRGRIKWATLGDENTKFFHVMSTPLSALKELYKVITRCLWQCEITA